MHTSNRFKARSAAFYVTLICLSIGLGYSQTFSATGSMPESVKYHTTTLLQDGNILVAGGTLAGTGPTSNALIYSQSQKMFSPTTGVMNATRAEHTATRLQNGKVLIVGGVKLGGLLFQVPKYTIQALAHFPQQVR